MSVTAMNYIRKTGVINMNKTLTTPLYPEISVRSPEYEKTSQNQCLSRSLLRDAVGETYDVFPVNMNYLLMARKIKNLRFR